MVYFSKKITFVVTSYSTHIVEQICTKVFQALPESIKSLFSQLKLFFLRLLWKIHGRFYFTYGIKIDIEIFAFIPYLEFSKEDTIIFISL